MSIVYDASAKTLSLNTRESSYQMQIGPLGYLLHGYYGRRAEGNFTSLHRQKDVGFSPVPYELAEKTRGFSPDTLPLELSGANAGDFRLPAVCVSLPDGRRGADLRYVRHEIRKGKYALPGLPAALDPDGEAETLSVTLRAK